MTTSKWDNDMQSEMQTIDLEAEVRRPELVLHLGGAEASGIALDLADRQVGPYERMVKPVLDRVLGALLCLAISPVMLAVALAVFLQLGAPILFTQPRVGRGGGTFGMYKFRSMTPDRRDMGGRGWDGEERRIRHKSADDPRLVPIGRFIRKWSLDELPQLLNVVKGDMSLIGPRPELVAIVDRYETWQHQRHLVNPGMTGLWQVSERGNGLMHEHVNVDLDYVQKVSALRDLMILLRTVPSALGLRRGY